MDDRNRNRKYMMRCKRCNYQFVWDLNPIYNEIREAQLEYESITRILDGFPEHERTRDNERYMRLRRRAQKVIADIKDLKTIRLINERASEVGWMDEFKAAVRESVGDAEYNRLIAVADERTRPYTAKGLMKNYREE